MHTEVNTNLVIKLYILCICKRLKKISPMQNRLNTSSIKLRIN